MRARLLLVLVLLVLAAPALAQDPVAPAPEPDETLRDETVVVARKWEEDVASVPGAVTLVGARELADRGARTPAEATSFAPNVLFTEFTSRRLSFPFVRGIGSALGDPAVITYVDDVPQLGFGGVNLPLDGVERIELLRGPQGTLFGKNALGGVLHVVTERPTSTPQAWGGLGLGDYDLREYRLGYSGPLGEGGPLGSLSLSKVLRDGYSENDFTGDDVDDRDGFFGRGQVIFAPGDDTEVRITVFGERARDGGFALNTLAALDADSHTVDIDFEGVSERDVFQPSVALTHFGDGFELTSITAYQDWEIHETSDFDFSPVSGVVRRTREEQDYLYQELRLSSPEDDPARLTDRATLRWLVGASGFVSSSERSSTNDFLPGGAGVLFDPLMVGSDSSSGDFDDVGIGLFGQATVTLDERWELGAGLRWDHQSVEADLLRSFDPGGFPINTLDEDLDEDFDELMPRASIGYHVSEDVFLYGLAARGFKAGGFNLAAPSGELDYDSETSWTYEAGVKMTALEGDLELAVSVFHVDWEDMQLSLFDPVAGGYVDNAGESTSQGLELEGSYAFTDHLRLFGSAGLSDTEIDEFVDPFGQDTSGNDLPFAPERTAAVGAQVDVELEDGGRAFLRGEYRGVGKFYYDAGNLEGERYTLANLRFGLEKGRWRLDAFLHNAFDEEFVPVAFQPNPADPTLFVGESGAPRTVGLSLTAYL